MGMTGTSQLSDIVLFCYSAIGVLINKTKVSLFQRGCYNLDFRQVSTVFQNNGLPFSTFLGHTHRKGPIKINQIQYLGKLLGKLK